MKTPRELLFGRHRSAEAKLDVVRQNALSNLSRTPLDNKVGDEVTSLILSEQRIGDSLRRLLLSLRWHLAGMSAIWLLVAFLNIDHSPSPTANMAREKIPSPRQILTALLENRREILLLVQPPVTEPASLPPRRSEIQSSSAMA